MKIFVMDLDGTQIDPTKSSLNERNIILNHLPAANAEDLISEAEEYTLSHPLEFSWTRARGMNCVLVENKFQDRFKTPQVFVEYAKKLTIPVVSDISRAQ